MKPDDLKFWQRKANLELPSYVPAIQQALAQPLETPEQRMKLRESLRDLANLANKMAEAV